VPAKVQMTMAELYALDPVVDYTVAGRAWGMARHKAARMLAEGTFPVEVKPVGVRKVCTKADLFESLGIPLSELGKPAPDTADASPAA
jgi:hypothetical protein